MNRLALLFITLLLPLFSEAQKDLLADLQANVPPENAITSSFMSSRLVLGQTTRQMGKNELQVRISHVFGRITSGYQEFWGIDNIENVDIALEYGFSNNFQMGLARSSDFNKTLQASYKINLLSQQADNTPFLNLTYFGSLNVYTRKYETDRVFKDRLEYVQQLLASHKLNNTFSFLVAPTYVHINQTASGDHGNDLFSTGVGMSIRLTSSMRINTEYYYTFPTYSSDVWSADQNALSFGLDLETGGHVFLVFLSNAKRLQTSGFIPTWNNDRISNGDFHIGFSIMRSFNF